MLLTPKYSWLMLVLQYLLVVNVHKSSLKINKSFYMMLAKSFNLYIVRYNYMITIGISKSSILTTQVLLKSGDKEINPGPKRSSAVRFCCWNLNGLAAHNFDMVCLSESFLDSVIPHYDENINIRGYWLIRVHHPNNIKRGGVCIYFKESLPLIKRSDLSNMKEYLITEINVNRINVFLDVLNFLIFFLKINVMRMLATHIRISKKNCQVLKMFFDIFIRINKPLFEQHISFGRN